MHERAHRAELAAAYALIALGVTLYVASIVRTWCHYAQETPAAGAPAATGPGTTRPTPPAHQKRTQKPPRAGARQEHHRARLWPGRDGQPPDRPHDCGQRPGESACAPETRQPTAAGGNCCQPEKRVASPHPLRRLAPQAGADRCARPQRRTQPQSGRRMECGHDRGADGAGPAGRARGARHPRTTGRAIHPRLRSPGRGAHYQPRRTGARSHARCAHHCQAPSHRAARRPGPQARQARRKCR